VVRRSTVAAVMLALEYPEAQNHKLPYTYSLLHAPHPEIFF
jgi:hypothetical protein